MWRIICRRNANFVLVDLSNLNNMLEVEPDNLANYDIINWDKESKKTTDGVLVALPVDGVKPTVYTYVCNTYTNVILAEGSRLINITLDMFRYWAGCYKFWNVGVRNRIIFIQGNKVFVLGRDDAVPELTSTPSEDATPLTVDDSGVFCEVASIVQVQEFLEKVNKAYTVAKLGEKYNDPLAFCNLFISNVSMALNNKDYTQEVRIDLVRYLIDLDLVHCCYGLTDENRLICCTPDSITKDTHFLIACNDVKDYEKAIKYMSNSNLERYISSKVTADEVYINSTPLLFKGLKMAHFMKDIKRLDGGFSQDGHVAFAELPRAIKSYMPYSCADIEYVSDTIRISDNITAVTESSFIFKNKPIFKYIYIGSSLKALPAVFREGYDRTIADCTEHLVSIGDSYRYDTQFSISRGGTVIVNNIYCVSDGLLYNCMQAQATIYVPVESRMARRIVSWFKTNTMGGRLARVRIDDGTLNKEGVYLYTGALAGDEEEKSYLEDYIRDFNKLKDPKDIVLKVGFIDNTNTGANALIDKHIQDLHETFLFKIKNRANSIIMRMDVNPSKLREFNILTREHIARMYPHIINNTTALYKTSWTEFNNYQRCVLVTAYSVVSRKGKFNEDVGKPEFATLYRKAGEAGVSTWRIFMDVLYVLYKDDDSLKLEETNTLDIIKYLLLLSLLDSDNPDIKNIVPRDDLLPYTNMPLGRELYNWWQPEKLYKDRVTLVNFYNGLFGTNTIYMCNIPLVIVNTFKYSLVSVRRDTLVALLKLTERECAKYDNTTVDLHNVEKFGLDRNTFFADIMFDNVNTFKSLSELRLPQEIKNYLKSKGTYGDYIMSQLALVLLTTEAEGKGAYPKFLKGYTSNMVITDYYRFDILLLFIIVHMYIANRELYNLFNTWLHTLPLIYKYAGNPKNIYYTFDVVNKGFADKDFDISEYENILKATWHGGFRYEQATATSIGDLDSSYLTSCMKCLCKITDTLFPNSSIAKFDNRWDYSYSKLVNHFSPAPRFDIFIAGWKL